MMVQYDMTTGQVTDILQTNRTEPLDMPLTPAPRLQELSSCQAEAPRMPPELTVVDLDLFLTTIS